MIGYIDLSLGSYIFQLVLAFGLTGIAVIGIYWKKIVRKLKRAKKNKPVNQRP